MIESNDRIRRSSCGGGGVIALVPAEVSTAPGRLGVAGV